jgi:hypothetical protein
MLMTRHVVVLGGVAALLTACAVASNPSSPAAPPGTTAAAPLPVPTAPGLTARTGDLPLPVRQVLPNGLRLIVQDHRAADIVAVYLYVGVGVRYEKPDQLGFAHFQEHMLFKGTDKWGREAFHNVAYFRGSFDTLRSAS